MLLAFLVLPADGSALKMKKMGLAVGTAADADGEGALRAEIVFLFERMPCRNRMLRLVPGKKLHFSSKDYDFFLWSSDFT